MIDDLTAGPADDALHAARLEEEVERLQRELAAEREEAHKWRTYTLHRDMVTAVEAQVKAERERDEARAAIRAALPCWHDYRIDETIEMRKAYERLRAALGGEG